MLKTFLLNTSFIACIVFSTICFFGCIGNLMFGDIFMTILCGIGLAVFAGSGVTLFDIMPNNGW